MNLDFSNVPKREAVPEGMYLVTIEAIEEKQSKTDKPMLVARFKEPNSGSAIFENFIPLPENMWRLQDLCDALGIDTSVNFDTTDFIQMAIGRTVKVKLIQREYPEGSGEMQNSVKKFYKE